VLAKDSGVRFPGRPLGWVRRVTGVVSEGAGGPATDPHLHPPLYLDISAAPYELGVWGPIVKAQ